MRQSPSPFSPRSLAFKVSLLVVGVEFVILMTVAVNYRVELLARAREEIHDRLSAVGELVAHGGLTYETLGDEAVISGLLGPGLEQAMVVSVAGVVFQSTNPAHIGETITNLPDVDARWLRASPPVGPLYYERPEDAAMVYVRPLVNAVDRAPLFYAYFVMDPKRATGEFQDFLNLLLQMLGVGALLTSAAILIAFRVLLFRRLANATAFLRRLTSGDLAARLPIRHRFEDELSVLQEGLNDTAIALEMNMSRLRHEVATRASAEKALQEAKQDLERRVAERTRALRESTVHLQGVMRHSPSAISVVDPAGKCLMANERFLTLFGGGRDTVAGLTYEELFDPDDANAIRQRDARVFIAGAPLTIEETLLLGEASASFITTTFPILSATDEPEAICAVRTDITEQRRLEAEAIRAGQLAALGELAASVAHELNNPLTGIINYAQIIDDEWGDPDARAFPGKIIREGHRMSRFIDKLLSLARNAPEEKGPVEAAEAVEDALQLVERQLRNAGVRVERRLAPGLPCILGVRNELQQVMLNLLNNAFYAVRHRDAARLDRPTITIVAESANLNTTPAVALCVCDNGDGVPAGIRDRITTPFFSTKPRTEGTGLGLAITQAILKAHGGRLEVNTREGDHTCMIALFPAAR